MPETLAARILDVIFDDLRGRRGIGLELQMIETQDRATWNEIREVLETKVDLVLDAENMARHGMDEAAPVSQEAWDALPKAGEFRPLGEMQKTEPDQDSKHDPDENVSQR